ncbi:HPr family phosphocarrier protein [Streptomyces sp. NPDC002795]|uniref:HPr family phosphocarrier protein n=1 Tax=Streptomyces sp. NPDC002795 TaxID=3364665 RepID=UPI00367B093A
MSASAERLVTVGPKVGLHARPATVFVHAATAAAGHEVRLERPDNGASADGRSVLAVMALSAHHGDRLRLTVTGDDADRVASQLAALVEAEETQ